MLVIANTFMHSVMHYAHYLQQKSARWPSGNELDSGTVGLGSNPGSVKLESCQRLATAATFASKGAVLSRRKVAAMGPANSFHASA